MTLVDGGRAWVQPDAVMATNRVITPSEGAGIYAYATDSGSVVRGSLDRGDGTTWVADAVTGALPCESGFVRTSAFTGSEEQLYCLVSSGEGYSVAQNGILAGESNNLFAFPDTGAILFGVRDTGSWVYFSDAETGAFPTTPGWVVTRAYGQGLQRYWLEWGPLGILGARVGYSTAGYAHYTLPGVGYVLRGSAFSTTHYYRANNDGLIVESVKMAFPGKVITQNMGVTL